MRSILFQVAFSAFTAAATLRNLARNGFSSSSSSALSTRQALPSSYKWTSTGPLIGPKNDGRNLDGIKDPTIVEIDGTYHVFASTAQKSGYNLVYLSFTDFEKASGADFHYLDETPIGKGYRAAPQVFYFAPQKLWYLVYQNGNAAYSTNPDIGNPAGWTAPKNFYSEMPAIIKENIGNGNWVDMWVICDDTDCHLFSSDDKGRLYRSQTSLANFPAGMDNTVIALSEPRANDLFEASCVYKVEGGGYLLLVEAIGSDGQRWFRSWTSKTISGKWTPQAAEESNPFARSNNVQFNGNTWTKSISHGEIIRTQTDQTLTIKPCGLRFLYQGLDPTATGDYNALPYRLALLTETNNAC